MTKNGRRLVAGLAAAGILGTLGLSWESAQAATATGNVAISASVANNCTVSGGTLDFGAYDPIVTHAATNLDVNGTVTVRCTRGTNAQVGLDLGANASGSNRRMSNGSGEYLQYELYTAAARATVWNDTNRVAYAAASRSPFDMTVYGRVPMDQDVVSGAFTDTVVATIEF